MQLIVLVHQNNCTGVPWTELAEYQVTVNFCGCISIFLIYLL
jgi:hypothetical protein